MNGADLNWRRSYEGRRAYSRSTIVGRGSDTIAQRLVQALSRRGLPGVGGLAELTGATFPTD